MTWKVDPSHSHITFDAKHMGLFTVRGLFENFEIELNFDEENPAQSSLAVSIDAASINTKETKRDAHLASPDFLNAAEFPTLKFTSTRVDLIDGTRGVLIGGLTIRDVTHEVTLNVELLGKAKSPWGVEVAAFSAVGTIDRRKWDLTWNVPLEAGGWLVSNEINIDIELEAHKVAEAEAETAAAD